MSTAASLDLRRRVVEAYLAGDGTYEEIAEQFGVGEASVSRWLRIHRQTGDVAPRPHAGGVRPLIADDELDLLVELVRAMPDATAEELAAEWAARYGAELSRSSMQRALVRAGFTWKKNDSVRARANARSNLRAAKRT
jgi:transposase